ncbi:hypothetical protein K439DRAFT_710415 [Ramaria rubella]|nr:hypothetical protein K439DRAFT_710415 [Ramaria rubella]
MSVVIGELLEMTAATCYTDKPDEVIILLDAVVAAIVMLLSLYKMRSMVDWRESIVSFGTKTRFRYTSLVVSESFRRAACALTVLQAVFIWLHAAQKDPNSPTSFIFSAVETLINQQHRESGWELTNMSDSGVTPDPLDSDSTVMPDATRIDKGKGRAEQVDCVQRNNSKASC